MAVAMKQIPRLRPGFRFQWEPAQNAHVLLYPEGMVRLNDSAGAVLKEVDGQRTVSDIVKLLQQQFPDAGSLEEDVSGFLKDAEQQHWILFS
ncbi:pyrroloquinoline quinone biosynthesis peptide chaperone PqqD [Marinobacter panjinensis]|uniref:PqqA binding protein n=1 Tax=Marinobacter panjinensis TaxID=2576384 RepID=A0A4U6R4H6_9GAMM|nr:pyrroloquinoline quinone biosynthesis peptide chaperone PqqD [Marinobacter panjinensis]MCR8916154.1 pyrroloquinoline quinone biosynthesis peptide chaperone PqqD [Marinobacter panjinensis]TKV68371.1 pyrroloquinoline quinone biosynthesis peptide chaperone PqqD [Marinobacter panjinensis]